VLGGRDARVTHDHETRCPICEQPICSLRHVYDRLTVERADGLARVVCGADNLKSPTSVPGATRLVAASGA